MNAAIFDVDGVLVDTAELNRQAYAAVGIDVPDYAFGRSWRDWLPKRVGSYEEAERINLRKKAIYTEGLLNGVSILAGADVVRSLRDQGWYCALCSHSTDAMLDVIASKLGLQNVYRCSAANEDKAWVLQRLVKYIDDAGEAEHIVYVDDNIDEGRRVAAIADITFIPFVNDPGKLESEIVLAIRA